MRVVFLVHLVEAWDSCAEVVRLMEQSEDFEPIVVSIPRRFNGEESFGFEDEVHRWLDEERIAHLRIRVDELDGGTGFLETLAPDLLFRQSQWDDDIPEVFATDRLQFARTCLIPYETMNIVENVSHPDTTNSALDSTYHRSAWVVFCANDLVLELARGAQRQGEQFRIAGHPKVDELRNAQPFWPIERSATVPARARIAWSAHHSIGTNWTMFGAFPAMAPGMLRWARTRPDWDFVFLPHPALIPFCHRPESPLSRQDFEAWHDEWTALPNTATSTHGRYAPVLAASDLLVTDGLSLLVEYQLFERPLVFLERAGHRPFNQLGQLVQRGAHTVKTAAGARTVAEQLLHEGSDPLRTQQRQMVARLFGPDPSAPRILASLRELIESERADDTSSSAGS